MENQPFKTGELVQFLGEEALYRVIGYKWTEGGSMPLVVCCKVSANETTSATYVFHPSSLMAVKELVKPEVRQLKCVLMNLYNRAQPDAVAQAAHAGE